jgi:large subunit ribosomal protein L10
VDRAEKEQLVSDLHQTFQDVATVVVTRPNGLTVAEANDLRRQMYDAGAKYKVAKNTLARLALDGTQFEGLLPMMQGQTALAWSEDPVTAAKTVVEYANKNKKLEILGGAYGEKVLDAGGVEDLARASCRRRRSASSPSRRRPPVRSPGCSRRTPTRTKPRKAVDYPRHHEAQA